MKILRSKTLLFIVASFCLCGVAYAALVGGTGKQTLEATSPEGQFISLLYEVKGQTVLCGIHVKKLVFEFPREVKSPTSKQYLLIHELKPASNKVEFAYDEKGSKKQISGETTFSELDNSSGQVFLTIANLPFSEPNKKFKVLLSQPFEGILQPVQKGRK